VNLAAPARGTGRIGPVSTRRPTRAGATQEQAKPELRRLAALVMSDAAQIADAITRELLTQEPTYREGEARVPEEDLRATVHGDVEAVLAHLATGQSLDPELRAQREIGERRAEQGLPLESLLRAYQLGAQLTWQRLVDAALEDPDADLADLLRGGSYLWEVVDQLCIEVATAYRKASAAIARRKAQRREILFDALLDGRGADVTLAREAAVALFLPVEGPYVVVVSDEPLEFGSEPELALRSKGMASCWRVRGKRQIGIVAPAHVTAAQLAETLSPHAVGRAGLSPPTAYLGGVAELVRLAELALLTVTPGRTEVALFDDNMVGGLIVSAPDVARRLADRVLSPLLALEPASRTLLIETLRAYFEADGSVAVAADRLFCHRNTVLNRLRRAEGLMGLDLSRPQDLTTLIVVLESLRLLPAPTDEA
jgi:hypothetical protein